MLKMVNFRGGGQHRTTSQDVAPSVNADAIHTLTVSGIAEEESRGVCIREVWEAAVATGEYHVGHSNCHHAAYAAYNRCAKHAAIGGCTALFGPRKFPDICRKSLTFQAVQCHFL